MLKKLAFERDSNNYVTTHVILAATNKQMNEKGHTDKYG